MHAYPHQMSGGIRQRVAGAIAISCQPSLLIADEPTTSLDVTIQAQYLRLLKDIQRETNLAMVFVTHDLGIVAKLCDRVAVMYAGRIVETGHDAGDLRPAAPSLHDRAPELSAHAAPRARAADRDRGPAAGSRQRCRAGCAFAPRCPLAEARCTESRPPLEPPRPDTSSRACAPTRRRGCMPGRSVRRRPARRCGAGRRGLGVGDRGARGPRAHQALPASRAAAIFGRTRRHGEGGRRRDFDPAPGRDAGPGRRERLRQDDHGAAGAVPGARRPAAASASAAATSTG